MTYLNLMAVATATLLRIDHPARPAGVFARRSRSGRMGLALALAAMLLFSQWLGLSHGIAHAGWPGQEHVSSVASFNAALFNYVDVGTANSASSADGKHHAAHEKSHHSCVEYDAAAGAAGIHAGFFSPPLIPGTQVLALWQAFASWDAPAVCHFSSRAPPR
ncbi:hypothetical protein [Herbaspirillum sp. NPDC101396]|uniref:hypothetical protein n=1 Tax=Herbaspirillum sp. NPDC101396 TaxID=3364005 RepID=UPI00383A552C